MLSTLPIIERIKLATKGTREQRAQLIRDSNRMVSTAVLSSPKVNESEVEAFAKMANVSEDVLRIIGANRTWMKNYGIAHGLVRNPKTPPEHLDAAAAPPVGSRCQGGDHRSQRAGDGAARGAPAAMPLREIAAALSLPGCHSFRISARPSM